MPLPRLSDWEGRVDASAQGVITHTITIDGRQVEAQGVYSEGSIATGYSAAIEQQSELLILKSAWPTKPNATNRIRTPRKPGQMFQPIDVQDDEAGTHWLFRLKRVTA